jgi:hypothetical protein
MAKPNCLANCTKSINHLAICPQITSKIQPNTIKPNKNVHDVPYYLSGFDRASVRQNYRSIITSDGAHSKSGKRNSIKTFTDAFWSISAILLATFGLWYNLSRSDEVPVSNRRRIVHISPKIVDKLTNSSNNDLYSQYGQYLLSEDDEVLSILFYSISHNFHCRQFNIIFLTALF